MNLQKIRNLRHVNRFNFHHVNKKQNVAEHSFYVAIYAREFARYLHPDDTPAQDLAFEMAFEHDFEEAIIGDIPYLVRKSLPSFELERLHDKAMLELGTDRFPSSRQIELVIEFADAYELKVYLEEERKSGNTHLYDIECETFSRLVNSPLAESLGKYMKQLETVDVKPVLEGLSH